MQKGKKREVLPYSPRGWFVCSVQLHSVKAFFYELYITDKLYKTNAYLNHHKV